MNWSDKALEKRGHATKYHRLQPPSWEEQQAQAEWLEEEFDKCFHPYSQELESLTRQLNDTDAQRGDWYRYQGVLECRILLGGYYLPRRYTGQFIRPMFETQPGEPEADTEAWDDDGLLHRSSDATRWPEPFFDQALPSYGHCGGDEIGHFAELLRADYNDVRKR